MGLFYTNVILYKVQPQKVIRFLRKKKRVAYVSPSVDNFIVIYDKETEDQDTKVLKHLTETLTRELKCRGLASLVHDSDLYLYWLYDNGILRDAYNSSPGYFDMEVEYTAPQGGDAKELCTAFDRPYALAEVRGIFKLVEQGILNVDADEYLQGEDIHAALVQALGIPSFSAFTGYYTIENTNLPEELDRKSLAKL